MSMQWKATFKSSDGTEFFAWESEILDQHQVGFQSMLHYIQYCINLGSTLTELTYVDLGSPTYNNYDIFVYGSKIDRPESVLSTTVEELHNLVELYPNHIYFYAELDLNPADNL